MFIPKLVREFVKGSVSLLAVILVISCSAAAPTRALKHVRYLTTVVFPVVT